MSTELSSHLIDVGRYSFYSPENQHEPVDARTHGEALAIDFARNVELCL